MSFFGHLICADCGSDNIIGNGDNDCCGDCGSHNYIDAEDMTEEEWDAKFNQPIEPVKPINAKQYLDDMFGSWVPIFGGKQ
jgi:hypothetical protein